MSSKKNAPLYKSSMKNPDNSSQNLFDLQRQHFANTPSSVMRSLADFCDDTKVKDFDVYGDFHLDEKQSYLRKFESDLANFLGKDNAVFMPSGTMAQSIALLIHSGGSQHNEEIKAVFACHHTCHLLLHEEDSYRELLGINAVVICTKKDKNNMIDVPPMSYEDVKRAVLKHKENSSTTLKSLILELPHRELGGKLTPWEDVQKISAFCKKENIKFHCDGARLFEASAGYGLTLSELAKPFDSIFLSFYKGLGAISGSVLIGDDTFCDEARMWLCRFGGNIYTLLPSAVSSMKGFEKHFLSENEMSFEEKRSKLIRVVDAVSSNEEVMKLVTFDPQIPSVNMIRGYLKASLSDCFHTIEQVEKETGIRVLSRIREIPLDHGEITQGYKTFFELTMGEANGSIDDDIFIKGWTAFAKHLRKSAGKRQTN